jgi:hypothetical protein
MRNKYNMSATSMPWFTYNDEEKKCSGVSMTPRVRELINIAWASRPAADRDVTDFFADVSQDVARQPWGPLRCLTSTAIMYSYENDRVLDTFDIMAAQGLPVCADEFALAKLSTPELRDLCGEAMFVPSVASVLLAFYLLPGPWWEEETKAQPSKLGRGGP